MEKKELFTLARENGREFEGVEEYRNFLEGLFRKEMNFPIVIGYKDSDPNSGRTQDLVPLNAKTRLTVLNYIEGLKELESDETQTYHGEIFYSGIETMHRSELDTVLLNARVRYSGQQVPSFGLRVFLSSEEIGANCKTGYHATSEISKTTLQEICAPFEGPTIGLR